MLARGWLVCVAAFAASGSAGPCDCPTKTTQQREMMREEVADYEKGKWYQVFIDRVNGDRRPDARTPAIHEFLVSRVLVPGQSVLELGAGAGAQMKMLRDSLREMGGFGNLVAVDMVPGWVAAMRKAMPEVMAVEADVTEVVLPDPNAKFDLVVLADVLEHVPVEWYACIMQTIVQHTHAGSAVYVHMPSPEAEFDAGRRAASTQFFENMVAYHEFIILFARFGFQLEHMELDRTMDCSRDRRPGHIGSCLHDERSDFNAQSRGAKCCHQYKGRPVPKQAHMLFRRVDDMGLLNSRTFAGHASAQAAGANRQRGGLGSSDALSCV